MQGFFCLKIHGRFVCSFAVGKWPIYYINRITFVGIIKYMAKDGEGKQGKYGIFLCSVNKNIFWQKKSKKGLTKYLSCSKIGLP